MNQFQQATNKKLMLLHLLATLCLLFQLAKCQLPDDIQRELNQNLAEQARIQAMRQQHQAAAQNRASGNSRNSSPQASQASGAPNQAQVHDPNNYSYQQVSPPIQYSYYQPYGDAATTPSAQPGSDTAASRQQQQTPPINFDFNNLNFNDLPQPQAQVASQQQPSQQQQQHYTPSFTGAGGLPIMRPIGSTGGGEQTFVPVGQAPLAPQARTQQGPPLTEADFKDITGGENYGAPSGNEFGLGNNGVDSSGNNGAGRRDDTDSQLREFGLPADNGQQMAPLNQNRRNNGANMMGSQMDIPDFGAFNPLTSSNRVGSNNRASNQRISQDNDNFGANLENLADVGQAPSSGGGGGGGDGSGQNNEFDFAGQPSSQSRGGNYPSASVTAGGAPGSLQSLLGNSFPGLSGGGLDDFARNLNSQPQGSQAASNQAGNQRMDNNALDIADLGEKSDQFSGADLGGFEQPSPQNDQDFNYASASNQQPSSVPYPDGNPQPVGTLWALTQPQSLTQTRYNVLPDHGTYQDYPAYQAGGNDMTAVRRVVDATPRARPPGPDRYGTPSPNELAPEHRSSGSHYDYGRGPNYEGEFESANFMDDE